ncbi:MAG: VanW family protein [Fimbriimonadaceae bacterium]|nr:MAG: VanW family protein [Fimbriimonadaceae bacterium]
MQPTSSDRQLPTLQQSAWFRTRVILLQCQRGLLNAAQPIKRFQPDYSEHPELTQKFESVTPLFTEDSIAERRLQLGKIQNLRIALRQIDGICIPAGETFSFWRQIGRATKRRGFKPGRELREGCIIPSVGGGLCQISNALYDLALQTGCQIDERHPHTQVIPGSAADRERDATVAWNHIDLRFTPHSPLRIRAKLTQSELVIQFFTEPSQVVAADAKRPKRITLKLLENDLGSCMTCGETACHRHDLSGTITARQTDEPITFLVDAVTPEFAALISAQAKKSDLILAPLDGHRFKLSRYQLPGTAARTEFATTQALIRALKLRGNHPPPVSRRIMIDNTEQIARTLASKIPFNSHHLVIDIKLLNGLCDADELGNLLETGLLFGRTFSVFLSRIPMALTESLLDEAATQLPDANALADFRVPSRMSRQESQALGFATELITASPYLAEYYSHNNKQTVSLIHYILPNPTRQPSNESQNPYLYFPGPTAARKGAHAVREVAKITGLPIAVAGKNLDTPDFWKDISTLDSKIYTHHGAIAVIAPSALEDRPSQLLQAFMDGVPIITTAMAGLPNSDRIMNVEFNDVDQMVETINILEARHPSPL